MRIGNDAAIRNDRLTQGRAIDLATGQKTRMGVDWSVDVEEAVGGNQIRQFEVRFVKRPNRSNVLPVAFEDVGAHVPVLDRLWNDMFAEINQVVLQASD